MISDVFGADRERPAHRPTGDVLRGDLGHQLGLPCDGVAMERRHHQSATVAMHVVVDHQDRAVAEQAAQHRIRFARMENPRVSGEHRLDVGRVGQIHHLAHHRVAQREHIAVAAPTRRHEPRPPAHHHEELHHRRKPRSRGRPVCVVGLMPNRLRAGVTSGKELCASATPDLAPCRPTPPTAAAAAGQVRAFLALRRGPSAHRGARPRRTQGRGLRVGVDVVATLGQHRRRGRVSRAARAPRRVPRCGPSPCDCASSRSGVLLPLRRPGARRAAAWWPSRPRWR